MKKGVINFSKKMNNLTHTYPDYPFFTNGDTTSSKPFLFPKGNIETHVNLVEDINKSNITLGLMCCFFTSELTLRQRCNTVPWWKIFCQAWTTSGRKDFTIKTCPSFNTSLSDQVQMTFMALRRPPSISSRDRTWIIAVVPHWDQEDMLLSRFIGELSSSW